MYYNGIKMIMLLCAVLGAIFGSFAGAMVWRLRAAQLRHDQAEWKLLSKQSRHAGGLSNEEHETFAYLKQSKKERLHELKALDKIDGSKLSSDRSRCLSCQHVLRGYDLIPLVSWVSTGGRCRYCRRSIGWLEPIIELGMALLFVLVYLHWTVVQPGGSPLLFALWAAVMVMLGVLFVYDLKWFLLPDAVMLPLVIVAVVLALLRVASASDVVAAGVTLGGAVATLGGLYWALYTYSRYRFGKEHTWVGFGDVKLGLALGLLVGDWKLAFLAVFLANFIGLLVVFPSLITKRLSLKAEIPFGPLLIVGSLIALFYGSTIIGWYEAASLNLALLL